MKKENGAVTGRLSDSDEEIRLKARRRNEKKKSYHRHKSKDEKKYKKKRHRKRSNECFSSENDDDDDFNRRCKRSKKERKRRRRDHKRDDKRDKDDSTYDRNRKKEVDINIKSTSLKHSNGQKLAHALHNLLKERKDFASELPLILIRLAGGTTFDLHGVTDTTVVNELESVFESLEIFGVKKQATSGMWMQIPPDATRRDDKALLRAIRSLLDDEGLTMDEIGKFKKRSLSIPIQLTPDTKDLTFKILDKFKSKDSTLGLQLATICKTMLEEENVSIDGIQDNDLKASLESLFVSCGLEISEIEEDPYSDSSSCERKAVPSINGSDYGPLMGYGLPNNHKDIDSVKLKLAGIMSACREGQQPPRQKVAAGPIRRPLTNKEAQEANAIYGAIQATDEKDDDDNEGPMLPGLGTSRTSTPLPVHVIKTQAEYRELELKSISLGIKIPTVDHGREEWMLQPKQHDFLFGIQSGPIKSRGFQNKKSRDTNESDEAVNPAIQAEIDTIMQAHNDARGRSLMDEHRSKKAQEKLASNRKAEWNWNRNSDLDAGRRVDKEALSMILGGAADNLKTKFKGGFNR